MSTRCNVILKEDGKTIYLYHHFDGYPEGVGADLKNMLDEVREKTIPYNIYQWANHLLKNKDDDGYELTSGLHGDIDYYYQIDTVRNTLRAFRCWSEGWTKSGEPKRHYEEFTI